MLLSYKAIGRQLGPLVRRSVSNFEGSRVITNVDSLEGHLGKNC